jgi:hypothetical protein
MRKGISGRLAIGTAAAAILCTATGLLARPSGSPAPLECKVTMDGDPVTIRSEPLAVQARTTEAIGDTVSASIEPESRITVVGVARDGMDNQSVRLTLNTAQAVAGEFALTLKGERGECTGTIKVAAAEKSGMN